MEKQLRVLFLEDSSPASDGEILTLREVYDFRKACSITELKTALQGFVPQVLIWKKNSELSPQDVLRFSSSVEKKPPIILPFFDGNMKSIFSLLESISKSSEISKTGKTSCCELQERYSSIYQTSLDGILVTKPNGSILAANPAACEMLEMTEEEICSRGRFGLVDPEDPGLSRALSQREKSGKTQTELTFVKKSGVKFPVELTSSVYADSKGALKTTIILRDISKRKEIEEQLRVSHDSYKKLFYKSPIPYFIYDQKTLQIVEVNEFALMNYGYLREEFLKKKITDLRAEEDIPELLSHLNTSQEDFRRVQLKHFKKDGTPILGEVYCYNIKYGGRDCRFVATIDVTEKENVLARLEQKKARLTAAQEIARIGYWEYHRSTDTFFLSDMMYELWGVENENFKPSWHSIKKIIHSEDRKLFSKSQDDLMNDGKESNLEYRILYGSGEIRWIQENGRVVSWQGHKPEKIERTARDITEEKSFIEKLTTSEARYRGIVQSQTNYIIRTDMFGNYTYYNEKFFRDFSWLYNDNDIIGQPSLSSIMEYHHNAVKELVARCISAPGVAFQMEIDKPRQKGGIRTTLWDFVCLTNSKGVPSEIQCVGTDISARVQAEKELKNSRLKYKIITEATSDAIWDWNIKTGDLHWGSSYQSIFGHDPNNHQSLEAWTEMLHPDDVSRVSESLTRAVEGRDTKWESRYRFKRVNGEYAYVIDKGIILRNEKGIAYRALGAIQDITEKKKLEDLLKKATSLSRIGSFEVDLINNDIYWSAMTRKIHEVDENFSPSLEKGINFYKKGKSRDRIKKVLEEARRENKAFDEELMIMTAKGKELWVRVIGEPVLENRKCIKINGSFQDIDKIKRSELEVLNAALEKETLLESIGDAFFAVNDDWTVTYWNKHAIRLLDCPKQVVLQRKLWDIFPDAIGTPFQSNYEATMKDRQGRHFEAFFPRTSAWYEVNVYPSHKGLSVFFKDVTERKTADVKLRELNKSLRAHTRELVTANKGLEQFSYIVSHNLRSPVANILGLAELLQNSEYSEEVREKLLAEIFLNIERLDAIVNDLNGILQAKIDIKAKKEKLDLDELIDGITSSIKNVVSEEKAKIHCDFGEFSVVTSVRSYFYSIFYNLIVNSIKYRRPGVPPVLQISAKRKGGFVIFSFRDNGMGIDLSNKKDQIFTLYKRFHHHIEGKGMGLFMVRTQVEMLGGKILVESKVDEGTEFTIIFREQIIQSAQKNETDLPLSGN